MLRKRWLHIVFSGCLIGNLLFSPVAQVLASEATATLPSPIEATDLPVSTRTPESETGAVMEVATPEGVLETSGRLLLAPALDMDELPNTNPVAAKPVPFIEVLGKRLGIVTLGAQVEPESAILGIPVTFRVWHEGELIFEDTATTDAWGAAAVEVVAKSLEGKFTYQASAPGYGETEIRQFYFDFTQASYTMHASGAQLWYWRQGPGQVLLTLRSPVPLQAGRDQAYLMIARRPELGTADVVSSLYPLFEALVTEEEHLPFPQVPMEIVGTYTATVALQLPIGDYAFMGAVRVAGEAVDYYPSQRVTLQMVQTAAPQALPVWASGVEYEPGQMLVRYQAEPGHAVFALQPQSQPLTLYPEITGSEEHVVTWRVGPFSWQEERYELTVDAVVDDDHKVVTVSDFDYDPIVRRYTLDIHSLYEEMITDTLHVEVLGPEGLVIQTETAEVVLHPDQVLHYSVSVPAELGRPTGLRIILEDPFEGFVRGLFSALKTFSSTEAIFSVTNEYKIAVFVMSWEIINLSGGDPPGWNTPLNLELKPPESDKMWDAFIDKLVDGEIHLGDLSFKIMTCFNANVTFGTQCFTEEARLQLQENLDELADDLDASLEDLKAISSETIDVPSIPVISPPLAVWIKISNGVRGAASAENVTLSMSGEVGIKVTGVIGAKIPGLEGLEIIDEVFFKGLKKLWRAAQMLNAVLSVMHTFYRIAAMESALSCDPEPPDLRPPDDRQDVWYGVENFYMAEGYANTIDNLTQLVSQAQEHQLPLAKRFLALKLREQELARFQSDSTALDDYLESTTEIWVATAQDVQGIISGTVTISPSLTLTDAVRSRMVQGQAEIQSLPYGHTQAQLLTALALAERDYQELYGQELTLQQELQTLLFKDAIGVLASGFAEATLAALTAVGLPGQLLSPWPTGSTFRGRPAPYVAPAMAPRALIIPSGGLHAIANSPEAQQWLDEYVAGGGLLVVFSQAFGADWQALPGGEVDGVGYEEEQRWQHASVQAGTVSNWLTWMGIERPDIQVDGAFTAWPASATILLRRTLGAYIGYPAMLQYPYGDGLVLATTAYGDWAFETCYWWGDDWPMTRSILIRAYLLARDQDIDTIPAADPDSSLEFTFSLTNTSALTITSITVRYPESDYAHYWTPDSVTFDINVSPGDSIALTSTLTTPQASRGTHDWTQVGLYHLQALATLSDGTVRKMWGPFIHVHTLVSPPTVTLALVPQSSKANWFATMPVTATVYNQQVTTQTVVLRGEMDLPTAPVTLTIPPLSQASHTYIITVERDRALRVDCYGADQQYLGSASTAIKIAYPSLYAEPHLPTPLSNGSEIPVTVTNLASLPWERGGNLALTLTAPSGVTLWSSNQFISPMGPGGQEVFTFTMAYPALTEFGAYTLTYEIDDLAGLSRVQQLRLPREVTTWLTPVPEPYRVRDTITATMHFVNRGPFPLEPTLSITMADVGLTHTQSLQLPPTQDVSITLAITLPTTLTSGNYPVEMSLSQDAGRWENTLYYTLPPAHLEAEILALPTSPGQSAQVRVTNTGGVDAALDYLLRVRDNQAVIVATQQSSSTVQAGAQVVFSLTVPTDVATDNYRLLFMGWEAQTGQRLTVQQPFSLVGLSGQLEVHTDQPSYQTGESISAQGTVTAGGVLSGSVQLEIVRDEPLWANWSVEEQVNPTGTQGYDPDLVVAPDGTAYAVWISIDTADNVLFAYRSPNGVWSVPEQVNDAADAGTYHSTPAIDLDSMGNIYIVWQSHDPISPTQLYDDNVFFAYRTPSGYWSANELVNEAPALGANYSVAIAADSDGNAHVIWQSYCATSYDDCEDDDIYYNYRNVSGEWSGEVQVNDDVYPDGYAEMDQQFPDIAVDLEGNAYAVWEDNRTGYEEDRLDVYFAYRPVSGSWGVNERISHEWGQGYDLFPKVDVNSLGQICVVWKDDTDPRWGYFDWDIYITCRLADGTWTANERISDDFGSGAQYHPQIALDETGIAYIIWDDHREGGYGQLYFDYQTVGDGTGHGNVRVNDPDHPLCSGESEALDTDADGNVYILWNSRHVVSATTLYDLYFVTRTYTGGPIQLWENAVPISTTATQLISETAGTLDNQPGKYWVQGTLYSAGGQTLATSRQPFYIYPLWHELTLEADPPQARPGEPVHLTGWLTNTDIVPVSNVPLTVTVNGQSVFTYVKSLLGAGMGISYSIYITPTEDAFVQVTGGDAEVTTWVYVAEPEVTAQLIAPQAVGRQPISVTLLVTNTGIFSTQLQVQLYTAPEVSLYLQPGEVGLVQHSMTLTETTLVTAAVRGDVTLDLSEEILWGEGAELQILPLTMDTAGLLPLRLQITSTTVLPIPIAIEMDLDREPVMLSRAMSTPDAIQNLILWPGQTLTPTLLLDLLAGRHVVTVTVSTGSRVLAQEHTVLTLLPNGAPLTEPVQLQDLTVMPDPLVAGESASLKLTLANPGPAHFLLLELQLFDTPQQWVITATGWQTQSVTLPIIVPEDLPANTYFGELRLDGEPTPFSVNVEGDSVALGLRLDDTVYYPNELAQLTIVLTDTVGVTTQDYLLFTRYFGAEEYLTLTVPAGGSVAHTFTFTTTQAGRATVFLAHTATANGNRRVLMLDSLPVPVVDPAQGAYLTFDRLVYAPGDTIYFTATITGTLNHLLLLGPLELALQDSGTLLWSAPKLPGNMGTVQTGTHVLSYTLPTTLRMGRYTFMLDAGGQRYSYPVDVTGWKVTTRHLRLDRVHYAQSDILTATVELWNEGDTSISDLLLQAWVITPDTGEYLALTPRVSRTVTLQPGLNVFTVIGSFNTPALGPHRLLINVGPPSSSWRVAGATTQFDVSWAHIVALTTDRGNYVPEQLGTGQLDIYGWGPTQLIITATNGSTLLDTQSTLMGFHTFTFTLPTTAIGDYLLVARSIDRAGALDQRMRAYAVQEPRDIVPPTLTVTTPATYTIVTSAALTYSVTVSGQAADDRGEVSVLVNGQRIVLTATGDFTTEVLLTSGFNLISVVAYDAAGNLTYAPALRVYLVPAHGVHFTAIPATPVVDTLLQFQTVLTTSGVLSDVYLLQRLPTAVFTSVQVMATAGVPRLQASLDPAWYNLSWQGDFTAAEPVTFTVTTVPQITGTWTQVTNIHWDSEVWSTAPLTITIGRANAAPVAIDDSYETLEEVVVTGNVLSDTTGSGADFDPDGDPLMVQTINPPLTGTVQLQSSGSFVYMPTNQLATYVDHFTYLLSDGALTDTAVVTVTVTADNDAPQADAGADRWIIPGLVQLDGSASYDPEGEALTYQWVQTEGQTVALSDVTVPMPTFTATITNSRLTFTLVVTDAQGMYSLPDTVVLTVSVRRLYLPLVLQQSVSLPASLGPVQRPFDWVEGPVK